MKPIHPGVRRVVGALLLGGWPALVGAQHDHAVTGAAADGLLPGLGNHHHPITTTSPRAQRLFDQGLSLAYAFNHAEAKRSFERAIDVDSTCAMCWWGIAFVLGPNINAPMDPGVNAEAYRATQRALDLARRVSASERAYIEAIATRYTAEAPPNRTHLDTAYARAMRRVHATYRDDSDAATLFAQAQMELAPWTYWTAERAPREGTADLLTALEDAIARDPNNPGACHMYIHAVEAAFPRRAVTCAERLAALMPGAGHLVHMPAHIYLRVGRWDDAIIANEHAVHADESYIADQRAQGFYTIAYYPHNYHFLAFAATMAGREDKAIATARAAASKVPADIARDALDLQLLTAYPHVTLATFERWEAVLAEPLPPADLRLASGLAWYARGLAHVAQGRGTLAAVALDSVRAIRAALAQQPLAPVMEIAAHSLAGEMAAHQRRHAEAIAELSAAAKIEDGLMYMEPPYWHRPVRQRLGAILVDAGRTAEAERTFSEDLERFPDNVWSLRGLERARRRPRAGT